MTKYKISIPKKNITEFCRKWHVRELSLFGSVTRDDFRPDSDIDVLVSFAANSPWSLMDMVDMGMELESIFGRSVDLVEKEALRNPYRRRSILSSRQVIYAA